VHALYDLPGQIPVPGLNLLQFYMQYFSAPEQNRPLSNCVGTKLQKRDKAEGSNLKFPFTNREKCKFVLSGSILPQ